MIVRQLLLALLVLAGATKPSIVSQEARRILGNVKETAYSHKTIVDEKAGSYRLDCSGLATYILKRIAPAQLRAVPHTPTSSRPRAFEFHDAFVSAPTNAAAFSNGWLRVTRVIDAQPGDLIAWRKVKIIPGESTGHVVIVDESPVREDKGKVRVVIIDATSSPHAQDTRPAGTNGIGRGTMWFVVDEAGRPVGLHWKNPNSKARTPVPIAIGRVMTEQQRD